MENSAHLHNLKTAPGQIRHLPLKRIFDIAFSVAVLALGAPVFLLIAFLVRLSSPGPIMFSHERIGRGGKRFRCLKFRTMYPDAENRLHDLLKDNPHLKEEWQRCRKLKNDPRVTTIGRFLRQTSLDELPQFLNVLKGDLSVVGPRPVTEEELIREFGPHANRFLTVRPGLTGPWQVSGRSDTTYQKRVRFDIHYIRHRSFFWDLYLIFRTIPAMISARGAY